MTELTPRRRNRVYKALHKPLTYPAAQLDQTKQQLATLQSHVTQAVDEYKSAYSPNAMFFSAPPIL